MRRWKPGSRVRVLCGHACSLMNRTDPEVQRIAGKLARAGISVAALPATNLYLQGRSAGTPGPPRADPHP